MISKFRALVAELGVTNAILYGLDRASTRFGTGHRIFRYYLVAQPVPAQRQDPPRTSLKVREIGRQDPALKSMPLTAAVLRHRFRQPVVCLGGFKGNELVAYVWFCLGPYEEDEVRCLFVPMPPRATAWDFDIYIFPRHRFGRVFAAMWSEANNYLQGRGITWSVSRISAFNPASMASHRRLGARQLGTAVFFRGRRRQLMVATVYPYLHLSLTAKARPVIRLSALKGRV